MSDGSGPPAQPGVVPQVYTGGELPEIGDLLTESLNEFMENIGPYAMAGLGQMLIMIPLMMVVLIGVYVAIAVGVLGVVAGGIGLAAVLPESLAGIGMVLGQLALFGMMGVGFFGLIGLIGAIVAPINASLLRAVAAHQRGEKTLELTSAFSSLGENVAAVVTGAAILTALSMGLALMCYFPALLPLIFLSFAAPLIALHGRGAMDGIRTAGEHARAHLSWHAVYGLLHFAMLMVASSIPVVGFMFVVAFQVRAYRRVFGDGQEPVLA